MFFIYENYIDILLRAQIGMALKITCFAYAGIIQSCLANHFRVWYGVTKWSGGVNAIISYDNVTSRWLDGCEFHS